LSQCRDLRTCDFQAIAPTAQYNVPMSCSAVLALQFDLGTLGVTHSLIRLTGDGS